LDAVPPQRPIPSTLQLNASGAVPCCCAREVDALANLRRGLYVLLLRFQSDVGRKPCKGRELFSAAMVTLAFALAALGMDAAQHLRLGVMFDARVAD
jgi:hypothetical protein